MGFFIKNQILCKRKKVEEKEMKEREKEKKLVAARIELGNFEPLREARAW